MNSISFNISYNEERDILNLSYVDLPSIKFVYAEESEPNVLVFHDTDTDETVGFSLLDYRKHPAIWQESLIQLGQGAIIQQIGSF